MDKPIERDFTAVVYQHLIRESAPDEIVNAHLFHFGLTGKAHLDASPPLVAFQPFCNRSRLYLVRRFDVERVGRKLTDGSRFAGCIVHNRRVFINRHLLVRRSHSGILVVGQIQCHIHDHIFLSANHFAFAKFDQDRTGIDAKLLARAFRVPQKTRINSGIAE